MRSPYKILFRTNYQEYHQNRTFYMAFDALDYYTTTTAWGGTEVNGYTVFFFKPLKQPIFEGGGRETSKGIVQ